MLLALAGAAIGIAAAQAVGNDAATPVAKPDPPGRAEAFTLQLDNVPVRLTPGRVELD